MANYACPTGDHGICSVETKGSQALFLVDGVVTLIATTEAEAVFESAAALPWEEVPGGAFGEEGRMAIGTDLRDVVGPVSGPIITCTCGHKYIGASDVAAAGA